jgi:hypothetical protein
MYTYSLQINWDSTHTHTHKKKAYSPSSCELHEDIEERFNNPGNENAGAAWDAVSV